MSSEGDAEQVRYAEIHLNSPPLGWLEEVWRYPACSFVAVALGGSDAAALLAGESLNLAGIATAPVDAPWSANSRRYPSHTRYGLHQPTRSVTRYELRLQGAPQAPAGWDPLVADGTAPTFGSYGDAFAAFFRFSDPNGNHRVPNEEIVVTDVENRAWFEKVTLTPTMLTVTIDGPETDGARLELNSPLLLQEETSAGPGDYSFVLPADFRSGSILALTRDGRWLDYRHFTAFPTADDPSIVHADPEHALDALIFGGEGSHLEFKVVMPGTGREEKRDVLKTIVAFATGGGGTMLFGVDNSGRAVGVEAPSVDDATRRLTSLIVDTVDPPPVFDISAFEPDGKLVLAVTVHDTAMVHALFRDRPEFFVRRAASTFPAKREEIVALIESRSASRDGYWRR